MRRLLLITVLVAAQLSTMVAAQDTPHAPAAEAISGEEITRHVGVMADDSMLGRDTPSRGLELTAQYVADQFKRLGLKPAGDSGWFRRYWIFPQVDFGRSQVTFAVGQKRATASLATTARLLERRAPEHSTPAGVVLVGGRQTPKSLAGVDVSNKIVLYLPTTSPDAMVQQQVAEQLRSTSAGFVVLSTVDSVEFARRVRLELQQPNIRPSRQWGVSVAAEHIAGLANVLASAGIDLARIRSDSTPVHRDLPLLRISLDLQLDRGAGDSMSAPNVIGVIEGHDPDRSSEYLVYVAHMDHTGISRGRPDSINNGADDNASGTAGLIELARAFSQPSARPARSVVFLATSGAKGLWGSTAFTDQFETARLLQAVQKAFGGSIVGGSLIVSVGSDTGSGVNGARAPMSGSADLVDLNAWRPIAAVNLDRIGAPAGDSVVVDGIGDAQFATPPNWAATVHPELRLTVVDGGTAATPTSDQFAFVKRGVPSLSFHNWDGGDEADASDSPAAIDADREVRILRLAFYVGYDIANAKYAPPWTVEGRRAFLRSAGQ